MAEGEICKICRKGIMRGGTCTVCGARESGTVSANPLPKGQRICAGRYGIEGVLGGGGYGITYVAWDFLEQRRIALKEFFPSFALRRAQNRVNVVCVDAKAVPALDHARIRFHEEARLLLSLSNTKEIVDVFNSFEDNGTAYYTMELLQGSDMQKHLRSHGRMTWSELRSIVMQMIRALYATHQMGYIHRDVSPDNIFLLYDGTAKLIDFGNARKYKMNQQFTAVVKDKFTPREQYNRRGKQGPWTDIYSLCVTIYYALTGVLPKKATERNPAEESLTPLHRLFEGIPEAVGNAVQIGMSPDENRRYQSIEDFAYAMFPGQTVLGNTPGQFGQQNVWANNRSALGQAFQNRINRTMPVMEKPEQNRKVNFAGVPSGGGGGPVLHCVQGIMKGSRINLPAGKVQALGRGTGKQIVYPDGAGGVSRNQCSFLLHTNGTVYVRDDRSTYGTSVNGGRLPPQQWRPMKRGDMVSFGKEVYLLK